jgi:hypothetical protein
MRRQAPLPVALLALALSGLSAQAYDLELNSRQLREAYFLGKDTTFKLEDFLKEYLQELPVPEEGVHVQQVAIAPRSSRWWTARGARRRATAP